MKSYTLAQLIAFNKDAESQLANLRAQLAEQQAVSDAQAKALADRNQAVRKRTAITKLQRKWRSRHPPPRQTSPNLTEQSGGDAEHQSALRNKERDLRVETRQRQAAEHDLQVARADADLALSLHPRPRGKAPRGCTWDEVRGGWKSAESASATPRKRRSCSACS